MKRGVAILLALGMSMPMAGYQSAFAQEVQVSVVQVQQMQSQESDYDKEILRNAMQNIEQAEKDEAARVWNTLTQEQQYNLKYKEKMDKMMELHREFTGIKNSDQSQPPMDFVYRGQKLMKKVEELDRELSGLYSKEDYKYSYEYLNNSVEALLKSSTSLKEYYQNVVWKNAEQQKYLLEDIEKNMKIYDENFKKSYNYYMMTKDGKTIKKEVKQSEDEFSKKLKENVELLNDIYDDMETAYDDINDNRNSYAHDLRNSIKERIREVSFFGVNTVDNEDVLKQVEEAADIAQAAFEELDLYGVKVMIDDHANDKKFFSKYKELKSELDDINGELKEIESQVANVAENVKMNIEEIQKQELKEANENGYTTVFEYKNALKMKRESERREKIVKEAQKLQMAKNKAEEESRIQAERLYNEWMADRIDFNKPQSAQNRDKAFFMKQARAKLENNIIYKDDPYLINKIYILESQAYDEMWRLSRMKNADKFKLQELYDEYPNDFIAIVVTYKIEKNMY